MSKEEEEQGELPISLLNPSTGQLLSERIRPGLSSFGAQPEGAAEYLQPLFEFGRRHVPARWHTQTGLHILATAGMRLLDAASQRAIWASIERAANLGPFALVEARVISGAEEGAFM